MNLRAESHQHEASCNLQRRPAAVLAAWVLASSSAFAQYVQVPDSASPFTPGELALLPEYCQDTMVMPTYRGPQGDRWRAVIGPDFQHFHHYCRGLRDVNYARFTAVSVRDRQGLWGRALREYGYMLKASNPNMVLMPEILLRMGEAQIQLGMIGNAQTSLEQARLLKPDYLPAYTVWADQLVAMRQPDRARALLEEGLVHLPDHSELRKRMDQLAKNDSRNVHR